MKKKIDINKAALALHKKLGGKIEIKAKKKLATTEDWNLSYTPGVGAVSAHLAKHPKDARMYTMKKNSVAVVSDGSAVLGLGNIGPYGALPVMEGKAVIFKEQAGIDAFPIVLDLPALRASRQVGTLDQKRADEIVETIVNIAPAFGGINLEDIKAPECFYIEDELKKRLSIPVMHDDQHGTAIVVLAGLINAFKVVGKTFNSANTWITVSGVGAAGIATMKLIHAYVPKANILAVDTEGVIWSGRKKLSAQKKQLLTDKIIFGEEGGDIAKALLDADVFIGVSKPGIVTEKMIRTMNANPIIFALSNPVPEVMPEVAHKAGAGVVATGRSDFPNQVNNALVFPGIFRGALDAGVTAITESMKLKAAKAIAALVSKPTKTKIIPSVRDKKIVAAVAKAVSRP